MPVQHQMDNRMRLVVLALGGYEATGTWILGEDGINSKICRTANTRTAVVANRKAIVVSIVIVVVVR